DRQYVRRKIAQRNAIALCGKPNRVSSRPAADIEDSRTGSRKELLYPRFVDRKLQRSLRWVLKALPLPLRGDLVEPPNAANRFFPLARCFRHPKSSRIFAPESLAITRASPISTARTPQASSRRMSAGVKIPLSATRVAPAVTSGARRSVGG